MASSEGASSTLAKQQFGSQSSMSSRAPEIYTSDDVDDSTIDNIAVSGVVSPASEGPFHGEAPADRRGFAWIIFAMLGVGMLFPWNCYLTAADYFNHVFPGTHFEFVMSCVYNYPSLFVLLLSIKYGPRFSLQSRIYVALSLDFVVLILVPIIPYLKLSDDVGFFLTMICVFLTGVATATLFGSILGLSAFFPQRYTTAVMSGNGVAGIGAAFLRIVTKLALPQTDQGLETSSTIYFALAAGVLLICITSFSCLMRLPFTRYYLRHSDEQRALRQERRNVKRANKHQHTHQKKSVAQLNARFSREIAAADTVCDEHETDLSRDTGHIHSSERSRLLEDTPGEMVDIGACGDPHPSSVAIFKKIWPMAFSVMFTFLVSLALFPGVTLLIKTSTGDHLPQDWFSIILVTLFMIGDFTGRTIPRWVMLFTPRSLPLPVVLRAGFVALFWLCINPVIFASDYFAYGFMLIFALTNGYCGTLAMMFGPLPVEVYEKETAGTMMSFFLNIGILGGSNLALLLLYLLTGTAAI